MKFRPMRFLTWQYVLGWLLAFGTLVRTGDNCIIAWNNSGYIRRSGSRRISGTDLD